MKKQKFNIAMPTTYSTQSIRSVGAISVLNNPLLTDALASLHGGHIMTYTITHNPHASGVILTLKKSDGSKAVVPCHNTATARDIARNAKKPAYAAMIGSFKRS